MAEWKGTRTLVSPTAHLPPPALYPFQLVDGVRKFCIDVSYRGCDETKACCKGLQEKVNKIAFDIGETGHCLSPHLRAGLVRQCTMTLGTRVGFGLAGRVHGVVETFPLAFCGCD